jgi:lipoate-protein ligase B
MSVSFKTTFDVEHLGFIDYPSALEIQKRILADVIAGRRSNTLLTCEHPAVITYGRRASLGNILVGPDVLRQNGVSVYAADRGGDVTFHGPGQVVLYPIMDLSAGFRDLHAYLRALEQVVIYALRDAFGLNAYHRQNMTGVWVGPYKVSSIGIGVRHWVAYHGLSLNVHVDKKYFSYLNSCGWDTPMASIADLLKERIACEDIRDLLLEHFKDVFSF